MTNRAIPSCVIGTNADLMREVAELYIEPDDVIVDATFGRGTFWSRLPDLEVIAHDIRGDGVDLRRLPHGDETIDVLVLDPPYRLNGNGASSGRRADDFLDRYGLEDCFPNTKAGLLAMQALYRDGIVEAARVLSPRGRVFIKCQDLTDSKRLVPQALEVGSYIDAAGLAIVDLFVLFSGGGPDQAWKTQVRARRAHSYLLVAARSRYWRPRMPRKLDRPRTGQLFA